MNIRPPPVEVPRPTAGTPPETGIHAWLLSRANELRHHYPAHEVFAKLVSATRDARRTVTPREISSAVGRSFADLGRAGPSCPSWPAVAPALRANMLRDGLELGQLSRNSPLRTEGADTADFLDMLYPDEPLLCVGQDERHAEAYGKRALLPEAHRFQFVVPNPLHLTWGWTDERPPTRSARARRNIQLPRRYLVVESDYPEASLDDHASLIGHLASYLPLVMVVYSGNQSLHGWFKAQGRDEPFLRRFYGYARQLGADTAAWAANQFVRMPAGLNRRHEKPQAVYYFNPTNTVNPRHP